MHGGSGLSESPSTRPPRRQGGEEAKRRKRRKPTPAGAAGSGSDSDAGPVRLSDFHSGRYDKV